MVSKPCSCSTPPPAKLFCKDDHSTLNDNLARYGWSPVLVDAAVLAEDCRQSTVAKNLLQTDDIADWETLHEQMFDEPPSPSVTYRRSESGAPGANIEPKQSLELVRSTMPSSIDESSPARDSIHTRMQSWISIFHSIALNVGKILEWPEGALIGTQNDHDDSTPAPSIDLLRAFLYEAAPEAMGSSPHTDWGSLTVVWQDRVGGLETYCRAHDCWIPVPPLENDGSLFSVIVHIGDVTCLAIGKYPKWPSPLHRVRCCNTKRRSLVYFCYPPQGSLYDLQQRLHTSTAPTVIDEACSLLQDQSHQKQNPLPRDVYERILHEPLSDVFREKWAQVQR